MLLVDLDWVKERASHICMQTCVDMFKGWSIHFACPVELFRSDAVNMKMQL